MIKRRVRQIGRLKGILLPESALTAIGAHNELQIRVTGRQIILEAPRKLRKDWFKNASLLPDEIDSLARDWDTVRLDSETEWQWN